MIDLVEQKVADQYLCEKQIDGLCVTFYRRDAEPERTVYHATIQYPSYSQKNRAAAGQFHKAMAEVLGRHLRRSPMANKPDVFIYVPEIRQEGADTVAEFPFVVPSDIAERERFAPNLMIAAEAMYDQLREESRGR